MVFSLPAFARTISRRAGRWLGWCLRLVLALAPTSRLTHAQTLPSRHFGLAEGLPETSVQTLAQDSLGRIWVVTEVSAAWYDGYGFHTLTTAQGLPNMRVFALAADPGPAAGLWLGLFDGSLCYFDPATNRASRVLPRTPGRMPAVRAILPSGSGPGRRVWVGTARGELYCLRWPPSHGSGAEGPPEVQRRLRLPGLAIAEADTGSLGSLPVTINALAPGPAGSLWVATDRGLRRLDEATGQPRPSGWPLPPELLSGPVLGLCAAADGRLWCATATAGLLVLDPPTAAGLPGRVRRYTTAQGLCSDKVLGVVAAPGRAGRQGRVWAMTGAGLSYLDQATATTARCLPGTNLSSYNYRRGNLLLDREDNLWTASAAGLTQYPPDSRFALFGAADGLPGPGVFALATAAGPTGGIWVGTDDGLALLRPRATRAADRCRVLPRRAPAIHNFIRALLVRANGEVWAGAPRGGTAIWEPASSRWHLLSVEIPLLRETTVTSLAEDPQGRVWLTTDTNGLVIYDPVTRHYQHYVGPALAGSARLHKVLRGRTGTMWLCTDGSGLLEARSTAPVVPGATPGWQFRPVAPRPAGAERFSVYSVSEDEQGRLWLAIIGEGLWQYDPRRPAQGLRHVALREEPEAHLNSLYFVQCTPDGAVWLGSTHGLLRYEPATGRQVFFGYDEGFLGRETNLNAVLAAPDGTLWTGTVAGLMRYTPAGAYPNRVPPRPYLTGLRLFLRDTVLSESARLPHSLNHLTFDYFATSLTNPSRVRYQYRLAGFESRWAGPLATTSATYTNLPPGRYTFEVRAANESGVWSTRTATFSFAIEPPWWRTWWAGAGYVALFGLTLYGVRRRTRRQERERATRRLERQALGHLQELDRVKTDFFTNVSHELRTPLTLILGPAELLAEQAPDPSSRQRGGLVLGQARKLLALINQLLDLSKLDAGALRLHLAPGDVAALARQLVAGFESLAASRGLTLTLEAPPGPVPLVFDAGKLDEILTNLLANALRFTPAGGQVTLRLAEAPPSVAAPAGSVELAVRDTGPGISSEHLPRLFDRFYQADGSVDESSHGSVNGSASGSASEPVRGSSVSGYDPARAGTGIGLALVRELVGLHGGTVSVHSSLGQGTSFVVRLPRHPLPAAPNGQLPPLALLPDAEAGPVAPATTVAVPWQRAALAAPPAAAVIGAPAEAFATLLPEFPAESSAAPLTEPPPADPLPELAVVLIIEDSDEVRAFIAEALAPAGYRLLLAPDGAVGLGLARAEVPDLVVSDVMMPGLSGYEVCARLRADSLTSHIPVVLLTARSGDDDRLHGLETGAQAYLPKPFRPRELQAQVRSLLQLSQQQRARFRADAQALALLAEAIPGPAPAHALASAPAQILAPAAALPALDRAFLARVDAAVLAYLGDETCGVDQLSEHLNLSRTQLHRKLKALTGQAPGEYLRHARLTQALALLRTRANTVSEVAYQVGYASPAHFSTAFSREFGYPPSQVK